MTPLKISQEISHIAARPVTPHTWAHQHDVFSERLFGNTLGRQKRLDG